MKLKRYKHNLSSYQLLTGNMGIAYPVGLCEALPNDTFQHATSALIRLSPMLAPVMHSMTVRIHHFFVPHRLTWGAINNDCGKSWENFITGGPDGNDTQTVPTMQTTGEAKDVLDYMGVPTKAGVTVSAIPAAAYNLIWNEYYRDQDLQAEREVSDLTPARIAWEKDYITTCRPWPQKGPEVTLPISGQAPVKGIGVTDGLFLNAQSTVTETDGTTPTYANAKALNAAGVSNEVMVEQQPATSRPNIFADLSQATATNINDVRRAFALQRFQEARSRYGSRYTEYLRYLGVSNPRDSRLQRPEFLGGGQVRVAVSEVLQTSNDDAQSRFGVGDLYGHGIAAVRSNRYRRFIEEHGYIMTILSVRPRAIYRDALARHWLRQDKEDFYQRELEYIGQQAVYNNEVYMDATDGMGTFGYSDRYREYRENMSFISGDFRTTLYYWHLARQFTEAPALNAAFIECNPSERIFQVPGEDVLWMQVQHRRVARRVISRSAYGKII